LRKELMEVSSRLAPQYDVESGLLGVWGSGLWAFGRLGLWAMGFGELILKNNHICTGNTQNHRYCARLQKSTSFARIHFNVH
jgi:hypothetical protein